MLIRNPYKVSINTSNIGFVGINWVLFTMAITVHIVLEILNGICTDHCFTQLLRFNETIFLSLIFGNTTYFKVLDGNCIKCTLFCVSWHVHWPIFYVPHDAKLKPLCPSSNYIILFSSLYGLTTTSREKPRFKCVMVEQRSYMVCRYNILRVSKVVCKIKWL